MLYSRVEDTHFPQNRHLRLRNGILDLSTPRIMGILNFTNDSFHAESRITTEKELIVRAVEMNQQGADILDLGACSTRPGSKGVTVSEEIKKISSGLKSLRKELPGAVISVDTFNAETAKVAADFGADIINDISGGAMDPNMFRTVSEIKLPYILMHIQGTPENMQDAPQYENVYMEVTRYFSEKIAMLKEEGVNDIILDPGFGFGKTLEQNYELLESLDQFRILGRPLLVGLSRKSMIYNKLSLSSSEALNGTTCLNTVALMKGASFLRVHDVQEASQIISLLS